MKRLGLLGGMSWESTAHYYQRLNQLVNERRGRWHSAPLIVWNVDFEEIVQLQHSGDWDKAGTVLGDAAQALERAGAENLLICANTMHRVADFVQNATTIPLINIIDATAAAIKKDGYSHVGLLGTRFVMEDSFYSGRLQSQGLSVIQPDPQEQGLLHRMIFDELVKGRFEPSSRKTLLSIMSRLQENGAQAMVLGCTEFGLLLQQSDTSMPVFDTTEIHCRAAVDWMLSRQTIDDRS